MPKPDDDSRVTEGQAATEADQEPEVVYCFEEETDAEIRANQAYHRSLDRLRRSITAEWWKRLDGTARRYP
jgi:hypothetical protein